MLTRYAASVPGGAGTSPAQQPTLAGIVRSFRVRAGLSQAALAERAGLSAAALGAIEQGTRRHPHLHTLSALAAALNLDPSDRDVLLATVRSSPQATSPQRGASRILPAPATPLIGREAEVRAALTFLRDDRQPVRLLTLHGPGGVGKTRLALEIARELQGAYADGVSFVDLVPVRDEALVPATIGESLGLRESAGHTLRATVREHLAERELLLVLDNFEHLTGAAAYLSELLSGCQDLRVLTTSRTALGLPEEQRLRVEPLGAPGGTVRLDDALAKFPAVQLFFDCARRVEPAFSIEADNVQAIADVCRNLDGLPLAIELAAARLSALSPRQIAAHLGNRFELLRGGNRAGPSRHQTLLGAMDWSYELLSEPERRVLRRLAVFAHGWSLEAASAVCAQPDFDSLVLLGILGQLVDKSLVVAELHGSEMRYRLLETVRQYAWERLVQAGEADALRDQHRDWCMAMAERVEPEWLDAAQVALLDGLQDELRAALRWCIESSAIEAGLRLGIGCWPMWYLRARFEEGRGWLLALERLATHPDIRLLRGRALAFAAHLSFCEGDTASAEPLLRAALAIAEQEGDATGACICWLYLGHVVGLRGTRAESEALYERALDLARAQGSWAWQTRSLMVLARVSYEQGDFPRTSAYVAESLDLFATRDHPTSRARILAVSGRVLAASGEHERARAVGDESIALLDKLGDKQGQAFAHGMAALSALDRGARADAARHLAAVLALARETHERMAIARGLESMAELLVAGEPERAARLAGAATGVASRLAFQPRRSSATGSGACSLSANCRPASTQLPSNWRSVDVRRRTKA